MGLYWKQFNTGSDVNSVGTNIIATVRSVITSAGLIESTHTQSSNNKILFKMFNDNNSTFWLLFYNSESGQIELHGYLPSDPMFTGAYSFDSPNPDNLPDGSSPASTDYFRASNNYLRIAVDINNDMIAAAAAGIVYIGHKQNTRSMLFMEFHTEGMGKVYEPGYGRGAYAYNGTISSSYNGGLIFPAVVSISNPIMISQYNTTFNGEALVLPGYCISRAQDDAEWRAVPGVYVGPQSVPHFADITVTIGSENKTLFGVKTSGVGWVGFEKGVEV